MNPLEIKKDSAGCHFLFLPNPRWGTDTPDYILPMLEHLQKRLDQTGLLFHSGDDTKEDAWQKLLRQWEAMNRPGLIIGNARLYQKACRELPKEKVASYWEILADYGLPPAPHTHSNHFKPALVFDPWYFKEDADMQMYIRDILLMCNYEEAEDTVLTYRACTTEEAYRETFAKEAAAAQKPIVTYCNNCRDFLAEHQIPVSHMLDLIFSHTDEATQTQPPLTAAEREANLRKLREILLQAGGEEA